MRRFFVVFTWISLGFFLQAQVPGDFVLHNATVYDGLGRTCKGCGVAVKNGKIQQTGPDKSLKKKIQSSFWVNLQGAVISPGIIDPHAHFTQTAALFLELDLRGITSEKAMLDSLKAFASRNPQAKALVGRGWDQHLWPEAKAPNNQAISAAFPDVPVWLVRVDGHAGLANAKALELAGINEDSDIAGGKVELLEDKPSGILVDNAMDPIRAILPPPQETQLELAMTRLEKELFSQGLTGVSDLGLEAKDLERLESLYAQKKLSIRMYAVAKPSLENLVHWINRGPLLEERLHIRSFKFYWDGALGSYGAHLNKAYADAPNQRGLALLRSDSIWPIQKELSLAGFQLISHCIGDAALDDCLLAYSKALEGIKDHRARLEHIQLASSLDKMAALGVWASIQPRHAVSDAAWAVHRLGSERLRRAYPLKSLMDQGISVCLGTDFPVEPSDPLGTFESATLRKLRGDKNSVEDWLKKEAISAQEALQAMTHGAAKAQFWDEFTGSLQPGLAADMVVWNKDWVQGAEAKAWITLLEGKVVFMDSRLEKIRPELADLAKSINRGIF
jgi:predicted amidohydrolase YtcJ